MDLKITDRVALVCGSSAGLGRAIAAVLAQEGCRVALNGRDGARLKQARDYVVHHATGSTVEVFRADVTSPRETTDLISQVRDRFGSVDILVCNAGGPPAVSFHDASSESWSAALQLNLGSTIELCRAVVPIMRKRHWGRIICLTSIAAKQPLPGLILSTTARAGVLGFAKSLADEVAPEGITVNAVCPGYIRTDRVESLMAQRATQTGKSPAEILGAFVGDIPLGRIGEPEEFAAAVAFLASERASYITGVALQVDGGFIRSIV